jgi:RHS repeat-associated protein
LLRKNAGGFTIDDLKYNYKANNPNQLDYVNDVASTTKKEEGFPARTGATNDFTYDANGNLLNDVARGISTTYNLLNLVNTVTTSKGTQNYTYAADGTKISITPGVGINKTYIGAVEYNTGGTILRIGTEEGHVMLRPLWNENSKDSKYVYYYTIKDHLGNVRIVLDDDANANIWQKTDYNAFGLDAKNDYPQGISAGKERNNHLYNDKESDPETTRLDYGARQYDNVLGRWFVVDPLSDKNHSTSGYAYVGNSPLMFIDPFGLDTVSANSSKPVNRNDVVVFDNGTNATASVNEVTITAKKLTDREKYFSKIIIDYQSQEYNQKYFQKNPFDKTDYSPYNPVVVGITVGVTIFPQNFQLTFLLGPGQLGLYRSHNADASSMSFNAQLVWYNGIGHTGTISDFSGKGAAHVSLTSPVKVCGVNPTFSRFGGFNNNGDFMGSGSIVG